MYFLVSRGSDVEYMIFSAHLTCCFKRQVNKLVFPMPQFCMSFIETCF